MERRVGEVQREIAEWREIMRRVRERLSGEAVAGRCDLGCQGPGDRLDASLA
jgi:hypothetical protein